MTKSTHPLRIVTCCYCGARSTIGPALGGTTRLVCHGCGASIQKLEGIQPAIEKARKRDKGSKKGRKPALPHAAERPGAHLPKDRPSRRRKGKRKQRSFWSRMSEAVGDLDDVLDFDLDDIFD